MLNGLDPIIIFQFGSLAETESAIADAIYSIPLVSSIPTIVDRPPIPIYLSEEITGLFIDSESKNVDANTSTETKTDGSAPDVNQKGLGSTVKIELKASRGSIGLNLLSAMSDLLFQKLTSKEYSVSYLSGGITIFNGLIESFSINQNADDDLYRISIEIARGPVSTPTKADPIPTVEKIATAVSL
jgi:hypothetical protein